MGEIGGGVEVSANIILARDGRTLVNLFSMMISNNDVFLFWYKRLDKLSCVNPSHQNGKV